MLGAAISHFFHLDQTVQPKKIDIISEDDRKGRFGIYRFDGDRLVLCIGEDDEKDRPTEFSSKGRRMVVVFKRIEEPPPPAWIPLFKGKDLDNWQGDTKLLRWNNETLYLSSTNAKKPNLSKVVNVKALKNFELEFDIKMGTEGGLVHVPVSVQVRGKKQALTGPGELLVGYQLDVRPKVFGDLHHRSVAELKRVKVLPPAVAPANVYKKDDFNHVRIRCEGKHLKAQLNGATMLDEVLADMPETGLLSFHWSNVTEVLLQNVKMRELSDTERCPNPPGFHSSTAKT